MPVSKRPRHKHNLGEKKMLTRERGAASILSLTSRAFPVIIRTQADIDAKQGQSFRLTDVFVVTKEATQLLLDGKRL